jgi:hypothetical protein
MNKILALALVSLSACAAPTAGPTDKAAPSPAPVSASSLAVEQAVRDLDVGHDAAAARKKLEDALLDTTLPDATRDVANLALARALDRTGDKEKAIETVEALLAKHANEHPWALEEQTDDLLQTLVNGKVTKAKRDDSGPSATPIAKAIAPYFPARDGKVIISEYLVGGTSGERLETFDIARALREKKRESCALCDDTLNAHSHVSQSSWTSIPANRSKYDEALVVYYYDLESNRIPARYDELLPMKTVDVDARLAKGEGVIVVKKRESAPPMILMAAPRTAQLAEVEQTLSALKELPTAPVTVIVSPGLRPNEIKGVFRAARPSFRACAQAMFTRTPGVSGTITMKLKVTPEGTVTALSSDAPAAFDATFTRCMEKVTQELAFPASGAEVSVTYPLVITQD